MAADRIRLAGVGQQHDRPPGCSVGDVGSEVLDGVIGWRDGHIVAIDQTALPHQLSVLHLTTVDQLVDVIVRLAVRGAPLLGWLARLGWRSRSGKPNARGGT